MLRAAAVRTTLSPPAVCVAAHVSRQLYSAVSQDKRDSYPILEPWSGAQSTATKGEGKVIIPGTVHSAVKAIAGRPGIGRNKGRAVRFKGVPNAVNDPAEIQPSVAEPASDTRTLRGFHDTQMHELDSAIALRNAKALAMSLGTSCHFAWPVLRNAEGAIICGVHPEGPTKDFIGEGIMPRMSSRENAIKELQASWNQHAQFGLVPIALERTIRRNP